jgi:hypothetical protein
VTVGGARVLPTRASNAVRAIASRFVAIVIGAHRSLIRMSSPNIGVVAVNFLAVASVQVQLTGEQLHVVSA